MNSYEANDYKVFDLFHKQWALVSVGDPGRFNACTVGWGSLGTLWTRPGTSGSIVTVYLYPTRYTCELLRESSTFTVSFFPASCRKALGYMGSHSGRDGNKAEASGLTPIAIGESVTYEEAELTFLCKKIYQHPFAKEDVAPEIQEYYKNNPKSYPVDENGE